MRRWLLGVISVLVLLTVLLAVGFIGKRTSSSSTHEASFPEYNKFILISIDTLRPDFLGTYNSDYAITPNLDALAEEAWIFGDVIAPAASTAPSHKSLFYSVYPSIHGTSFKRQPTHEDLISPVEALRQEGFVTAGLTGGGQVSGKLGFARGFDEYVEVKNLDRLTTKTTQWLGERRDDSFFLFLHTYETHCPYVAPEPYYSRHASWYGGELDPRGSVESGQRGCGTSYYNHIEMTEEDVEFLRNLYAAEVDYVDSELLGPIFREVRELGIYEDTVIIVLSDHGECLGEHGHIGHNRLFECVLRVPLIIRVPEVGGGKSIEEPVELLDVMPTVFDLAGVEVPYGFLGKNLVSIATSDGRPEGGRLRIAEHGLHVAAYSGPWKLRLQTNRKTGWALFNIRNDPIESHNLITSRSQTAEKIAQRYRALRENTRDLASRFRFEEGGENSMDDELRERLRALGYLDRSSSAVETESACNSMG